MEKDKLLAAIRGLPPFPQIALKTIKTLKDPNTTADDLVGIIQYDQNITSNILKATNSTYFDLSSKVTSLRQAVSILGSKNILNILMLGGSISYFNGQKNTYYFNNRDLLNHSISSAILCQIMGEMIGLQDISALFTAGLLHDIGKVVLGPYVEEKYNEINDLIEKQDYSLIDAEREVMGMDHAYIGGEIAKEWKFPPEIVRPIAMHHRLIDSPGEDIYTPLVFLADQLYIFISGSQSAEHWSFSKVREAMIRCQIDDKTLDVAMLKLRTSLKKINALLDF